MKEEIYLTHVQRMFTEKNMWVPMIFITQKENDQGHYLGFELEEPLYSQEEVSEGVKKGALIELERKVLVKDINTQAVWLTEENKIYLANKKNPLEDQNKQLIGVQN